MNSETNQPLPPRAPLAPRRRPVLWPWICGALLGVVVAGTLAAARAVRLDGDAAALRAVLVEATPGAHWERQVQLSAGEGVLTWARLILRCTPADAEAHTALAAVRQASVGVWRATEDSLVEVGADVIGLADAAMHERGWERIVGVRDGDDTVLVYAPTGDTGGDLQVCVAVCDGEQLVVTSARTRLEPLLALMQGRSGGMLCLAGVGR